jgi:hypothetical protein
MAPTFAYFGYLSGFRQWHNPTGKGYGKSTVGPIGKSFHVYVTHFNEKQSLWYMN